MGQALRSEGKKGREGGRRLPQAPARRRPFFALSRSVAEVGKGGGGQRGADAVGVAAGRWFLRGESGRLGLLPKFCLVWVTLKFLVNAGCRSEGRLALVWGWQASPALSRVDVNLRTGSEIPLSTLGFFFGVRALF